MSDSNFNRNPQPTFGPMGPTSVAPDAPVARTPTGIGQPIAIPGAVPFPHGDTTWPNVIAQPVPGVRDMPAAPSPDPSVKAGR